MVHIIHSSWIASTSLLQIPHVEKHPELQPHQAGRGLVVESKGLSHSDQLCSFF